MYKLMIVDDEAMIRRGIKEGVKWEELGFQVVGTAKNGVEALHLLEETRVDVLLTDIKMPVMGGIELSKQVRRQFPDMEIVILSGFSEFEYAREAINFRAFEYLIKPTNVKGLIDTFKGVKLKLDVRNKRKSEMLMQGFQINELYQNSRDELLTGLLEGNHKVFENIDEKLQRLELDFTGTYFTAATIRIDKKYIYESLETYWKGDQKILLYAYQNIANEVLQEVEHAAVVIKDLGEINFIFAFESKETQEKEMIHILENTTNYIRKHLLKNMDIDMVIGIGLIYPSLLHISKSFSQAQKSLEVNFYHEDTKIQVFHDSLEYKFEVSWINDYPEQIAVIADEVVYGNVRSIKTNISEMFQQLNDAKVSPQIVKNYCLVLKTTIIAKLPSDISDEAQALIQSYDEIVKNSISLQALKTYIETVLCSLAKVLVKAELTKEDERNLAVKSAKAYIKTNYNKKISVQEICEELYLSPNYFSGLFKKVTGMTYMDYIQKVRMHEAKNLLKDPGMKVYEVGEQIGYNDYKYFALQFKKLVGVTPKEYRNQAAGSRQ